MESPYFQVRGVRWNNGALSQTVGISWQGRLDGCQVT